jgi:hypothetical protein
MNQRVFPEIVENANGGELIIEIDWNKVSFHFLMLVSCIHTELISLHCLMVQMAKNIIISHHFNEIVLTPFVMTSHFSRSVYIVPIVDVIRMVVSVLVVQWSIEYSLVIRVVVQS